MQKNVMTLRVNAGSIMGIIIGGVIGSQVAPEGAYGQMGEFSMYGLAIGGIIGTILWNMAYQKRDK